MLYSNYCSICLADELQHSETCYVFWEVSKSIVVLRAVGVEEGEVKFARMTIRWDDDTRRKRSLEMVPWSIFRRNVACASIRQLDVQHLNRHTRTLS
jgi:hypothetical protein